MPEGDLLQSNVRGKLRRLRAALKARLAGEGAGWLLLSLVALVFLTLGFDYVLDLDRPLRAFMMAAALAGLGYVAWRQLVQPLRVPMDEEALALLVERRWGDLNDRLISAVQFSHSEPPPGASRAMIAQMADEANARAAALPFDEVVERRNLRRTVALALCGAALLAGFTAMTWPQNTMGLWFRRNVLFENVPWPQDTYLTVQGPHDPRVLRGDDLIVTVIADEGSEAPPYVVFHAKYPSVGSTEERINASGDGRTYVMIFQGVSEEFTFRVTGGDDRRDKTHQVTLVDPPAILEVKFSVTYPSYTNLGASNYEAFKGVLSAPLGSVVNFQAKANKDLRSGALGLDDSPAQPIRVIDALTDEKDPTSMAPRGLVGSFVLTGDNRVASHMLRFDLTDSDGYSSRRGQQYMIQVQPDLPPAVEVRSAGVGPAITPNAKIPLQLKVRDDYGVAKVVAGAEFPAAAPTTRATAPATQASRPAGPATVEPPPAGRKEYRGAHTVDLEDPKRPTARPRIGEVIQVFVEAEDTLPGTLGGPNNRRGSLEFRIASAEEIAADLVRRQKEISLEFAQAIIVQNNAVAKTLAVEEGLAAGTMETPDVRLNLGDSHRSQVAVGANCAEAANRLQMILDEMVNNRVFSQKEYTEMGEGIIAPLRKLSEPIDAVAASLNDTVRLMESPTPPQAQALAEKASSALAAQRKVLDEMKAIHERMVRLENRQDLINQVRVIMQVWDQVIDWTEVLRRMQLGTMFNPASQPATTTAPAGR